MVKSTRNGKLPPTEFTGFAAFASHTSPAAAAAIHLSSSSSNTTRRRRQQQEEKEKKEKDSSCSGQKNKLSPSPIYTGNDITLIQIFKHISKKDSTTKSRALAELANYAFPCSTCASDEPMETMTINLSKNDQIQVFCHFYFLFVNKLIHDNNASVRNEAVRVFGNAMVHIPKACNGLLRQNVSTRYSMDAAGGGNHVGSIGNAIGWIYFFQSSQAVEEIKVAKRSWKLLCQTLEKFQEDKEEDKGTKSLKAFIVSSIVCHAESILHASSRAINLANALSVTSKSLKIQQGEQSRKGVKQQNSSSGKDDSGTTSLDDGEKKAMEERYERVVLLTLRAMESFFREYNQTTLSDSCSCSHLDVMVDPSVLWKHLNSQKSSFRRATFALISCVARNVPSLIHQRGGKEGKEPEVSHQVKQSNLSKLVMNVLSSERDPANFTPMFEMLLLYIVSFKKYHGTIDVSWVITESSSHRYCPGMDVTIFVKTLSKILRKACYGSPSIQWTPTMLPILATLQSPENQLQILSSLWNGRTAAVTTADSIAIVAASTECAMYLLVKKNHDNSADDVEDDLEIGMDICQIFLDCFAYYLSSNFSGTASASAEKVLRLTLLRDLQKLNALTPECDSCIFSRVHEWFWSEGICSVFDSLNDNALNKLSTILDGMRNSTDLTEEGSGIGNIQNSLRILFWKLLKQKDGVLPSNNILKLLVSARRFCSVDLLFDSTSSKEIFCTEKLIPWIFNDQMVMNIESLEILFRLLYLTLRDINSDETITCVWQQCLQGDPSKEATLNTLIVALRVLTSEFEDLISILSCSTFDDFASKVAQYTEDVYHKHVGYYDRHDVPIDSELKFLQLSVGLKTQTNQPIVRQETINIWIQNVLISNFEYGIYKERHILLEVLLSFARSHLENLSKEAAFNLIMYAWKQGGPCWESNDIRDILELDGSLRHEFLLSYSGTLSSEIECDCSQIVETVGIDLYSYLWADRAFRALEISHQASDSAIGPITYVGLGNSEIWMSAMSSPSKCDMLYLSLIYLLEKYADFYDRKSFITGKGSNIVIYILMTLACTEGQKTRRCFNLLHILGGDLIKESAETFIFELIDFLSLSLNVQIVRKSVVTRACIVLDWLVGITLPKFIPTLDLTILEDDLNQIDIKEGDELWYLTNGENLNSERKRVRVLKVHTDDFPNLYFSVELLSNDSQADIKQTIASRLKRNQRKAIQSDSASEISVNPLIVKLETSLISKLVKPFVKATSDEVIRVAAEVLNITVSHCGLQGSGGIGTTRFEAFQAFSTIEQGLRVALSEIPRNLTKISNYLDCFTISLGYGLSTSMSKHSCQILQCNADWLIKELQQILIDTGDMFDMGADEGNSLALSLVRWLTITAPVSMTIDNASFFWDLIRTAIPSTIKADRVLFYSTSVPLILDAILELNNRMQFLPQDIKSANISSEQICTSMLFKMFVEWDDSTTSSHPLGEYFIDDNLVQEHDSSSSWLFLFQRFLREQITNNLDVVTYGARTHFDGLLRCLSIQEKQWYAFQILFCSARKGSALYSDDNLELSETTQNLLCKWMDGKDEEEAQEIEEDVFSTAKWLPHSLMSCIESWDSQPAAGANAEDSTHEHILVEKLLQWIICLEYLDSAGKIDMRNRSHITSYIDKTNAIKDIFDIAMSFATFSKQDQCALFDCITISNKKTYFSLSELSTLVIFRSIESIPTLCKVWWNDYCPRSLSGQVSKFVESMVAPEILKRELERIDESADLGELSVSGSCVSREVVATYMQDECKLSVLIRVPPSFPLRNAEVDCQKTLGISEKRWRFWSLQIMRMLNSQDGSILDALLLWKQNVDKEFDGVEPCPVCYSVLCVKTHAMPNLECKTCHNRFHSGCLYKWFHSSGKNQCVLCQQPWSGIKIS
mmetsp:Transcript_5259/g.10027  ORF Transcript_5259/g.10027 Transcript_5259/m.10027 type:complete len:1897 (-) Transcript_5259:139-5829(-)